MCLAELSQGPGFDASLRRNLCVRATTALVVGTFVGFVHGSYTTDPAEDLETFVPPFPTQPECFLSTKTNCNELAFVNDYRTDIENFKVLSLQRRLPNACVVFVECETQPLAGIAITTPVARGAEILLDYGDEYWERYHARAIAIKRVPLPATPHLSAASSESNMLLSLDLSDNDPLQYLRDASDAEAQIGPRCETFDLSLDFL